MYCSVLLMFSGSDLMVIMFVALLLFGGDKLPELARGLGKGIRDFKDASEGVKREINNQINSYEEKKAEEAAAKAEPVTPVTPALEEHATPAQMSTEEISHENATDVTATHGSVPNTVPYVENHGVASNENNAPGEHATADTGTGPVKTTHE
jgi:sec-independent protein translocase protein TatA